MWIFVNLPKPVKSGGALILLLLCINPYIQFFKYMKFCQHKDQVIIEQTSCEGFTHNDNDGYYYGTDYLNFSIDVSFKDEEVVSFNAHTLVFKGDKYIGYIASDFWGTSERMTEHGNTRVYFESNTTQKLYFHISHPTNTSWQNDALFKELYEGNLEEYTFVTNIICVDFADGTMVGHYLSLPGDFYYDNNGIIHYKDQNSDEKKYYYYDSDGNKHYTDKKSDNLSNNETVPQNDNKDTDKNNVNNNENNALLDIVKNYAGVDAVLPDNYLSVGHHAPNCGWYSEVDEKYHNSYYIIFKVDTEHKSTFTNDFINKLAENGFSMQYDDYNYEYVKNNTVICFSNVLESRVDGKFEYYYMCYYTYPLN